MSALTRLLLTWELWELEHYLRDAARVQAGERRAVLSPEQVAAASAHAAHLRARIALLQPPLRRRALGAA